MVGSDLFALQKLRKTAMAAKANMNLLPGSETRRGCLMLVMGPRRQRLQVSIYAKTLDPFVVFYPDKVHCRHCGVLKLKGCRVEPVGGNETDFIVIPKSGDGGKVMVLGAESTEDRDEWVKTLTMPRWLETGLGLRQRSSSLRQQKMPSLPEINEICSDSSEDEDDVDSCHEHVTRHRDASPIHALPRSKNDIFHKLDTIGSRPRCFTSSTLSHDCDRPWDAPKPSLAS